MKIFIVTGTQEPFDRLIKAVDEWAGAHPGNTILAQISNASYKPQNMQWVDFIPPQEFDQQFRDAELIMSHAGMGTIISALRYSKPIVVMPRLAQFREHRNDHQLATARSFEKLGFVKAVYSAGELTDALAQAENIEPALPIGADASPQLIGFIKKFVEAR